MDHLEGITGGKGPEEKAEKRQVVRRIKEEIGRLNQLVTNFIMYGKPPEPRPAAVRIPDILESVLRMAGDRLLSQRIRLQREYGAGGEVTADPDMVSRAVVNLVANAIDAMPAGGTLTIWAGSGFFIQVNRDSQLFTHTLAELDGQLDSFLH